MLKMILKPILALIFVCAAIYITLCLIETTTLPSNARINYINCGGMTAEKAAKTIAQKYKFGEISILRGEKKIGDVKVKYNIDQEQLKKELSDIIAKYHIHPLLWYKLSCDNYKMKLPLLDDECHKKMTKKLKKVDGNHYTVKTKNAYIDYDNLVIKKEINGNNIDFNKLETSFAKDAANNEHTFIYKRKDFLKKPTIKAEDSGLKNELKFCKKYIKGGLNIISNGKTITLSNKELRKIIVPGTKEDPAVINTEAIKQIVNQISKKYKLNNKITVKLHDKFITLSDLGELSTVDINKTANSVHTAAEQKIKGNPVNAEITYAYNDFDYTKNYIEVNISKQKLYYYKNGRLKMTCNVVTGRPRHPTPKGAFSIMWKERNTVLRGFEDNGKKYESPVSYWMPLTDMGVGLHDANWRGAFGGDIYKYDGSHGCVNMPPNRAAWLYNRVPEHYPVFIH